MRKWGPPLKLITPKNNSYNDILLLLAFATILERKSVFKLYLYFEARLLVYLIGSRSDISKLEPMLPWAKHDFKILNNPRLMQFCRVQINFNLIIFPLKFG